MSVASASSNASSNLDYFAEPDYDRAERCGFPEVVFGMGKSPEQLAGIFSALSKTHEQVLATRSNETQARAVQQLVPDAIWLASCGLIYLDRRSADRALVGRTAGELIKSAGGVGQVVICCAGTSDLRVAEEAACTARIMGSQVILLTDIGVAGVHRVLRHQPELQSARVIVAVAGMEGALPSVVAGLTKVPVLAVPTSVGYGASFGGLAALLGMLNSCSDGVSVLNIDNGYGAGVIAHRINSPGWAAGNLSGNLSGNLTDNLADTPANPPFANPAAADTLSDNNQAGGQDAASTRIAR
ncbi:MAG: nickel pincer cofactor biosynthesis protein LarB [Coriobacteriales bacterium]|nr:nickel pincer cofactor biosynthesis protein LarB [Coriobacteriales bacterium]